jgi:N-acetyl-gamma-glutamyl-phosphate reductase
MLRDRDGVAMILLRGFGVDLDAVKQKITEVSVSSADNEQKRLQFDRVIEWAFIEATLLDHHHVGTEHLLLGLLHDHDGPIGQALRSFGVSVAQLRSELIIRVEPTATVHGALESLGLETEMNSNDNNKKTFTIGIVGISGYGGGEALRLCASHPNFRVIYAAGESSAGQKLIERFPGLPSQLGELKIEKWDTSALPEIDLLFASLPTGESRESLAKVPDQTRIVDIGGDHRFVEGWTYGLADIWPDKVRSATRVANPGCYPAASLTALAPLVAGKLIEPIGIIIDAKSGVSGAGRGGGGTFGYAEVNEDVAAYGLLKHAHVPEMKAALRELAGTEASLTFTPHLVPMTRGILSTCYGRGKATTAACLEAARAFYAGRNFVRVLDNPPHSKWATGSNLAYVSYAADAERGIVIALGAIDNLGKGAAGQAVQNANLMLGLDESAGLGGAPLWP